MQHDYNGFPNQDRADQIALAHPALCQVVVHNGRKLLMPLFPGGKGFSLEQKLDAPRIEVNEKEPVIRDINTPWDMSKYAEVRRPVSLGYLNEEGRAVFSNRLPAWCNHVLDMPIKFPGTDVRVPHALASLVPAIQRIIDIEVQLNPAYEEYYAYLSVHQAQLVPGERMRENPYHVDGFQGPRWERKHPVNHSYLLCDRLGTVFYPRSFPLDHIDPSLDDIYAEFGQIVEGSPGDEWRARDEELVLMDAYCVHRGDVARVPMSRTWLRISWETRQFDRLGNSHNPLFGYNWPMVARDTDPRIRPRQPKASTELPLAS